MSKKRITSIIMLAVLAIGIACVVYGVTGTGIYENAASMMGSDKKTAMTLIQALGRMWLKWSPLTFTTTLTSCVKSYEFMDADKWPSV